MIRIKSVCQGWGQSQKPCASSALTALEGLVPQGRGPPPPYQMDPAHTDFLVRSSTFAYRDPNETSLTYFGHLVD